MPKAYWVICHRSTKSPEKFAAFTKLAYPAIQAAGGRFLVRTSSVAKTYESGLNERTVVIEFEKPSPFTQDSYRTHKPGPARPHRQLSGPALAAASGRRTRYVIRAMTPFKTELAIARPWVRVT